MIEAAQQQQEANFEVLNENWEATKLFQAVSTQWRTAGMYGMAIGLDYSAVEVVMRRLGFADSTFKQLQVMEQVALSHWQSK